MSQLTTGTYSLNGSIVNTSLTQACWCLVYGGTQAYNLFESSGLTETKADIECWTTEQECLDRIDTLSLGTASLVY